MVCPTPEPPAPSHQLPLLPPVEIVGAVGVSALRGEDAGNAGAGFGVLTAVAVAGLGGVTADWEGGTSEGER